MDGPSFEVLDYISGTTRADSYMRIGEPELWRWVDQNTYLFFRSCHLTYIAVNGTPSAVFTTKSVA